LQNKPIGVLGVTNRLKETSFDSNDTRALSALGGYATIAINNANIYSEIEREKNTLSAVMDLSDNPILVIDENNRLLLTNSAARKHLGFVSGENPIGQPIQDILQDDLLAFIDQPQGTARQIAQKLVTASGQMFKAEMTLIEGGNRSVLLQPAG
jgi:transcriptional regulator with PAS, ATPase and Fis domain